MTHRIVIMLCCMAEAAFVLGSAGFAQNTTDPSASDRKFVHSALEGGKAEVQLGELAAQKGNSQDVKQFGQKMADDHAKMGDQMKQVAQKEGITPPTGIPAKDKALEAKLRTLSGDSFDKAYISVMVKDHRQDLAEFNREASSGNDTAIKDAASQGAQVIREHLQMAEQLAHDHHVQVGRSVAE